MAVAETQNILKQIYVSSQGIVESSEETSGVLQKIYNTQVKSARDAKKADAAEDRAEQRKKRDEKRKFADTLKLGKKKDAADADAGKEIGKKLKSGLGGLFDMLGPLLAGAVAPIAGKVLLGMAGLAKGIGVALLAALKIAAVGAAVAAVAVGLAKGANTIKNKWSEMTSDQGTTAAGITINAQDVGHFQRKLVQEMCTLTLRLPTTLRRRKLTLLVVRQLLRAMKRLEKSKSMSDQIIRKKKLIEEKKKKLHAEENKKTDRSSAGHGTKKIEKEIIALEKQLDIEYQP